MTQFNNSYQDRKVVVTGDSGFKGSWLTCWLLELGAEVTGLSLNPQSSPNHSELLQLSHTAYRGDIRNSDFVQEALVASQPEIVFHLAAQPLVRRSYADPLETWSTNVLGTANVLQACKQLTSLKAIVIVTTDKVYSNREWIWGYREEDRLGGHDPYSASKACTELLVDSFRASFFKDQKTLIATARAGNVIGGGDWAEDRLIPDLVRASEAGATLEIRSPAATRPWQHVLECLTGYLILGQRLLAGDGSAACAWNFGPSPEDNRKVAEVLQELAKHWSDLSWKVCKDPQPHEANLLYLDSSKAKAQLGWTPVWSLSTALARTAEWYKSYYDQNQLVTLDQLKYFVECARHSNCGWAC